MKVEAAVSGLQSRHSSHLAHFFLFYFAPLENNGKHGDGVQQGELKENAKKEEKSAD